MKIYDLVLDEINKVLKKTYDYEIDELDFPPKIKLGDFTFSTFTLAKLKTANPMEMAKKLTEELSRNELFEKVIATGPYVNIQLKNDVLFKEIIRDVFDKKEASLTTDTGKNKMILVEYLQPNTNKPLHLGHIRNGCLGMAISNTLKTNGSEVVKANLINDRGIHICKSMLAWQKWGNGETPESTKMKGDHFVGKWYVRYAKEAEKNPDIEAEARELLIKWEENDEETLKLWKMMNSWVFAGFNESEKNYGFKFDVEYFESETYKLGKAIIQEGLEKKIFYKDEIGAILVDLPVEKFGLDQDGNKKRVTLQRADGTSLYISQDLGTAKLKFDKYPLDKSIYVVGSEQEYHFRCLFAILEMLGYSFGAKCYHLSYGMVYLPDGKMKSREGRIVDADVLLDEMVKLASDEIRKRLPESSLDENEIQSRAAKVGLGAINFYLLKTNPKNDIYFDPTESISFDGATGPYCQYAYARATKIIEKSGSIPEKMDKIDWGQLGNEQERMIAQKIINLNKQIAIAGNELNPSKIATAIYELAGAFNQFYQKHSVINAENKNLAKARLSLVDAARINIQNGLKILNIETLDSM